MTRRKTISKEGPEERKQKFSTSSPPPATPAQPSVPSTVSGTPLRTHRSSFMHEGHTPPTIHQADLKKVMRAELGDQTWQLPLDRVANVEEILHGGNCCRGRASQVTQISYSVLENVSPSPHPFLTTIPLSPVALPRRSACVANAEAKKVVEAPIQA
ncbi:hypothetical protein C8J55DRAFT_554857 [Lentinula edodes]|uniref:Uncharacterized protein n=1 Tax=Lentinula lateritia TaxID=40482 RepID=A0A9W9DZA8_9AGAR|nr:hypothetical protein C8J55DRAFT_554857 [Lentinula edodes]